MNETQTPAGVEAGPGFGAARMLLDALASQDYAHLDEALAPQVRLRALLPGGPREWTGAEAVADCFAGWFGDTHPHELLQRSLGGLCGRIHLGWRLRVQAERLGTGSFVVEQQGYADADEHGRIARLDLVCTGYLREDSNG